MLRLHALSRGRNVRLRSNYDARLMITPAVSQLPMRRLLRPLLKLLPQQRTKKRLRKTSAKRLRSKLRTTTRSKN